jgi:carbonic anhydrase
LRLNGKKAGQVEDTRAKVLPGFSVKLLMSRKIIHGSSIVRLKFIAAFFAAAIPVAAAAAWQSVSTEPGKRVEIDRASIKKLEEGKLTALGRIVLEKPINDPKTSSSYRIIEALSRYDCTARTVSTLKRAYFKEEGDLLREEEVKTQIVMPVHSGSLDDKLLREVCRPKAGAEAATAASKIAEKANEAAAELRKANEAMLEKSTKRAAVPAPLAAKPVPAPAEKPAPDAKPLPAPVAMSPAVAVEKKPMPRPAVNHDTAAHAHARIHWAYEGAGSPDKWGKLSADYATCANGQRQSPIDIRDGIGVDLEPIEFAYRPAKFGVIDNGHTVQVTVVGGGGISLLGKTYQLVQFHFHRPSEERVNGKSFAMVAHLVHKSEDGKLAVLAVLLESGQENSLIQSVWNNLPLEKNQTVVPPGLTLDLGQLLPEKRAYYTYMGSLTTPPCSEGVLWLVLKQPQQMSAEQMAIFARLYKNNARPVQPVAGRLIKESR